MAFYETKIQILAVKLSEVLDEIYLTLFFLVVWHTTGNINILMNRKYNLQALSGFLLTVTSFSYWVQVQVENNLNLINCEAKVLERNFFYLPSGVLQIMYTSVSFGIYFLSVTGDLATIKLIVQFVSSGL